MRPVDQIRHLSRERQAELATAAVYGTVITLAAVATVSVSDVAHGIGLELVVGVGLATWIAHVFAELIGEHLRFAHAPEERDFTRAIADATPVLLAAVPPSLAIGLGHSEVVDDSFAIWLAAGIGIAQLFGICVAVGSISGDRRDTLRYGLAATVVGVVVVGVKIAFGEH